MNEMGILLAYAIIASSVVGYVIVWVLAYDLLERIEPSDSSNMAYAFIWPITLPVVGGIWLGSKLSKFVNLKGN
jgi:uncharacterized protein YggT (Ycf19 family)